MIEGCPPYASEVASLEASLLVVIRAQVQRVACGVQRVLLWQRRNNTVPPFNESVQQVFARISALRDSLDGPQVDPFLAFFVIQRGVLTEYQKKTCFKRSQKRWMLQARQSMNFVESDASVLFRVS